MINFSIMSLHCFDNCKFVRFPQCGCICIGYNSGSKSVSRISYSLLGADSPSRHVPAFLSRTGNIFSAFPISSSQTVIPVSIPGDFQTIFSGAVIDPASHRLVYGKNILHPSFAGNDGDQIFVVIPAVQKFKGNIHLCTRRFASLAALEKIVYVKDFYGFQPLHCLSIAHLVHNVRFQGGHFVPPEHISSRKPDF